MRILIRKNKSQLTTYKNLHGNYTICHTNTLFTTNLLVVKLFTHVVYGESWTRCKYKWNVTEAAQCKLTVIVN